ncbi:MetQ/NlpA family ABC transporter substrate-binding protein [Xanthobacter oligotrophicus]|uniref:MetQ/NlpA family ABC transporter substrate-binding protein n=1 Tax=Xanthobacter oligotrophicus TaxID=2607286 RepID=UPI0011F2BF8D|nr:MetQ/NlpA family ABC transporter substrate-binding protein [Xanthobacter oligotrophicus]MCG5234539.1 MetQ/NlpA family ABC transporter substrate-binding protein [Xanthobacter oligotrophicus]
MSLPITPRSLLRGAALAAALCLVGTSFAQAETIRVGVTAGPHAEVLDVVKKVAAGQGLDIKVVEFTDYVVPNQALANKELEANSFQHEPYLKNQVAKTGWKIVKVAQTIASPQGIYSIKYKSFDEVPAGATIAIQNDPSNAARSLQILAHYGLIKLKPDAGITATELDIIENPKKFKFIQLDAAQLPRALPDVDAASINNNYAVQAGLNPAKDALIREPVDGPWVNILAVREEDKDKPWVKQLIAAYHSDAVKAFLAERFKGSYLPTW